MRESHAQGKAAVWCGRLLLFTALIAGIVAMHTLGHPRPGHGGGGTAAHGAAYETGRAGHEAAQAGHAAAQAGHGTGQDGHGAGTAHRTAPRQPLAHSPASPVSPGSLTPLASLSSPEGGHGMDPGSVCLAVLSFWAPVLLTLLALAGLTLRRRSAIDVLAAARARLLRALWPIPPPLPRHKHLAQLSVLRV